MVGGENLCGLSAWPALGWLLAPQNPPDPPGLSFPWAKQILNRPHLTPTFLCHREGWGSHGPAAFGSFLPFQPPTKTSSRSFPAPAPPQPGEFSPPAVTDEKPEEFSVGDRVFSIPACPEGNSCFPSCLCL